jgi:hypothetical protein
LVDRCSQVKIACRAWHSQWFFVFCFYQDVEKLKHQKSYTTVDTWKGDEHTAFYNSSFETPVNVKQRNEKFPTLVHFGLDGALDKFPSNSIDFFSSKWAPF